MPPPGFPFGPYHRHESPTQSAQLAALQESSGELWGRETRFLNKRAVKAWNGPLQPGQKGIEFYSEFRAQETPNVVYWFEDAPGVWTEGEFAKIRIVVVKNTQA